MDKLFIWGYNFCTCSILGFVILYYGYNYVINLNIGKGVKIILVKKKVLKKVITFIFIGLVYSFATGYFDFDLILELYSDSDSYNLILVPLSCKGIRARGRHRRLNLRRRMSFIPAATATAIAGACTATASVVNPISPLSTLTRVLIISFSMTGGFTLCYCGVYASYKLGITNFNPLTCQNSVSVTAGIALKFVARAFLWAFSIPGSELLSRLFKFDKALKVSAEPATEKVKPFVKKWNPLITQKTPLIMFLKRTVLILLYRCPLLVAGVALQTLLEVVSLEILPKVYRLGYWFFQIIRYYF
jgi:hypothetical protein